MILSICDEPSMLNIIRIIVLFINIIKAIVPIILIIAVAIKITGAVTKNNQDDIVKTLTVKNGMIGLVKVLHI